MMYANQTHKNEGDAGIGIKVAVYPKSGEPEVSEVSAASPRAASEKFMRLIMGKVGGAEGRREGPAGGDHPRGGGRAAVFWGGKGEEEKEDEKPPVRPIPKRKY